MDLNLLPLARRDEQDLLELPGLHIAARPRRMARGRQPDRFFIYLAMEGDLPLSPSQQEQLLGRLSQTYYKTAGSVTAALRAAAEALNQYLLERNLSGASSGQQSIGLLILFTLREERLVLAQCGRTNVYLITAKGIQHFHDPQPTRRGLGLGKTTPIYFSQATLNENDLMLLAPQLPAIWNEAVLNGLYGQSLEALRPRILRQVSGDLNALLLQAKAGPGKTYLMRPKTTPGMVAPSPITEKEETTLPEAVATVAAVTTIASAIPEAPAAAPEIEAQPFVGQPPQIDIEVETPPATIAPPPVSPHPESSTAMPPAGRTRLRPTRRSVFATLAMAVGTTAGEFSRSLRTLLRRMLPGDSLFSLPTPWMAFIAVAIPLIVVAIATVVYFQRGRAGQYDFYYEQALQTASQAQTLAQTDLQQSLVSWETVIEYLDQAEAYQTTTESQSLRAQAYQAIDNSELIRRLDYKPTLIEALPETAQIIDLVATSSDIYLLDASTGGVWRAFVTARGYEIDTTFQCGPDFLASQDIGSLVDIEGLPEGGGPSLVGMDSSGGLLYCKAGEPPLFDVLTPPFTQWGTPTRFTIDNDNLYVLDPGKNAVWIYWNGDKATQPDSFFTQDFPPMQDVIDLAVDNIDLFLLHADGHITLCNYSDIGVAPTRCTDPLPYTDSRPGREGQPYFPYPAFSRISRTQPPDPSIYLLSPDEQSIYHFSQRLAYQRQLQPLQPLSPNPDGSIDPATAFTFSPDNRIVFLAVGNQVYSAGKP